MPVRFARTFGQTTTTTGDVSVMIQESAIMHDDQGNILRSYNDQSTDTLETTEISTTNEECYEMTTSEPLKVREPAGVHFC
jgi:hypothetical protein